MRPPPKSKGRRPARESAPKSKNSSNNTAAEDNQKPEPPQGSARLPEPLAPIGELIKELFGDG